MAAVVPPDGAETLPFAVCPLGVPVFLAVIVAFVALEKEIVSELPLASEMSLVMEFTALPPGALILY